MTTILASQPWHVYDVPADRAVDLADMAPDGCLCTIEDSALPIEKVPDSDTFDAWHAYRHRQDAIHAALMVAVCQGQMREPSGLRLTRPSWTADDIAHLRRTTDGYGGHCYVFELCDGRTIVTSATAVYALEQSPRYRGCEHWMYKPTSYGSKVSCLTEGVR